MSRSKNDLQSVLKILMNFVDGLSNSEVESLLNGTGAIKYVEKDISSSDKEIFNEIIYKLAKTNSQQEMFHQLLTDSRLDSKQRMQEFCRFLNLPYKTKDVLDALRLRIVDAITKDRQRFIVNFDKQADTNYLLQNISYRLEEIADVDEAVSFLAENELLKTKSNLILLAKLLDVYITKDQSSEEIIKRIIDSVVVAKLRSKAIREKRSKFVNENQNHKTNL